MAERIRRREISSVELMQAHLHQIETVNPKLNAAIEVLSESALEQAAHADDLFSRGELLGPLHGVPFSVKDSINVEGTRCTAGTLGFKESGVAAEDATLVRRLREAGGIPIAKTNLPDLLFSFESDNLIFGRTNNPYDLARTAGGSSGGEAALIAAGGSPLGLGSDAAGSVRVPAAFCGIAAIKPTSGRLPRTGHVPPFGGWVERLWQIGPMARSVDDIDFAMRLLSGEDGRDWTSPPAALSELPVERVAFMTHNGFARCDRAVVDTVECAAKALAEAGLQVEEHTPPALDRAFELELAILGADGGEGIDSYLREINSDRVHPLLANFVDRTRPYRATGAEFAKRWAEWDAYKAGLMSFFDRFDVLVSPVYTQAALPHGGSATDENFAGFSYTMAWNVAGFPAAVVRCGSFHTQDGAELPVSVQVIAKPWREMSALAICKKLEQALGGWVAPTMSGLRPPS